MKIVLLPLLILYFLSLYTFQNSPLEESVQQNHSALSTNKETSELKHRIITIKFNKQTDPSEQIQHALNKAKGSEIPIKVTIPEGTYYLKKTLHIYSNTWLQLSPDTILRKAKGHDNIMLINGDFKESYDGYKGNTNIIINGGIWDADGERTPSVFGLAHGENILIKDTIIKNVIVGHAVDLAGINNVTIKNCFFLGSKRGNHYTEAIQIDGMFSTKAFRAFGSVDFTVTKNVHIENSYFGDSNQIGMEPWGVGVGSHSASFEKSYSNINIINNTFDRLTNSAITGYNWEQVILRSNTFNHCKKGIQITSVGKYYYPKSGISQHGKGPLHNLNFQITNNSFVGMEENQIIYDRNNPYNENINFTNNQHY